MGVGVLIATEVVLDGGILDDGTTLDDGKALDDDTATLLLATEAAVSTQTYTSGTRLAQAVIPTAGFISKKSASSISFTYVILLQSSFSPTSHHFSHGSATPVCVGNNSLPPLVMVGVSGTSGVVRVVGVAGTPMQYHELARRL